MSNMTFDDIQAAANEIAEHALGGAQEVRPEALGLDQRAGYKLYAGEDFIAVRLQDDRSLQYYGGFEYVDKECRLQVGDHVFYSSESDRVCGHLERLMPGGAQDDDDVDDGPPAGLEGGLSDSARAETADRDAQEAP